MFDHISGHATAKAYLSRALSDKRLPNTLLFSGPEGIGKKSLAIALCAQLLGTSIGRIEAGNAADFHLISPEGKSGLHSIDALRAAMDVAHQAPFEAQAKVFVIEAAERMQPAAANALLKSLEEPQLDCYWILLTSNLRDLLPTIVSRCARVPMHAQPHDQAPESIEARDLLFSLLQRRPHYPKLLQTLELIETALETDDPLLKSKRAEKLFTSIALYYRDQELRRLDPHSPHLYFPTLEEAPIPKWEEPLDQARLAYERNIKLSTCLESFMLIFPTS